MLIIGMYINSPYYENLSWLNDAIVLTLSVSMAVYQHESIEANKWMNGKEISVKPWEIEIEWTTIGFSLWS
jgi:hypothetical protein